MFLARRSARRHGVRARADRDCRFGMRTQVQPPGGRPVLAAVRGDDHELAAVLEVGERRRPGAARPAAGRRQQQHGHPSNATEQPPSGEPVDSPVAPPHDLDRRASKSHGPDATAATCLLLSRIPRMRLWPARAHADRRDVPAAPGAQPPFVIVLAQPGVCTACGCNLTRTTRVRFDPATTTLTCVTCAGGNWPRPADARSAS